MPVAIHETPFDPWQAVAAHQAAAIPTGKYGATAVFVGTMRDFNEGDAVQAMRLEHYPGMTEKHLEAMCAAARERWPLLDTLILHRVGEIRPQDPIVLVAVWSAHRAAAFEASRFLMEELKSRAPFWKKESTGGGERWVEKNTPGY
ncbi:molybdenum cofactor biosynthesis protein MoaE [Ectothiorhodospiraceae bacterium 2226]|nr:molybdenum cofactor biosynthesis protein MoaE [Ectothiorhodospiraceae bacterium 2226]